MLDIDRTAFLLIDVQGRLAELMYERARLFTALEKWVKGMLCLNVPILWIEQNPTRMGPTIRALGALLGGHEPISKQSFSCCGEPAFMTRLIETGRSQLVLAGIETHVCVYQTALDLLSLKYEVSVAADAVSSRAAHNRQIGLQRIASAGAALTTLEMGLFEMLRTARHPAFKDIQRLVK